MHIEIVNTGSELMIGRVLNTHQQWLCRQLTDLGYEVKRQIAIADQAREIQSTVAESLSRADLVIATGGLGPTSDDITRTLIAQLLDRKLILHPETLERLEHFVARRKGKLLESMKVQAMIPVGARVLTNSNGTAPGLAIHVSPNKLRADGKASWLILLPGPPRELRPMFAECVVPLLNQEMPLPEVSVCLILRTTGLRESAVEQAISGPLEEFVNAGLDLGYCARIGEVEIRLAARGEQAVNIVQQSEHIARRILGNSIYAVGDETLESVVVNLLKAAGKTVAPAESCTGGFLAHRITNIPGASSVLKCGFVTYSNEAKEQMLGVSRFSLEEHGAVSETVARQMAEGARKNSVADFGIAITGIAGPDGGTESKPVGTVFLAIASEKGSEAQRQFNPFDRETFKNVTTQQALDMIRRALIA